MIRLLEINFSGRQFFIYRGKIKAIFFACNLGGGFTYERYAKITNYKYESSRHWI